MFKILDKRNGEVTAEQQAVFNKISTNNADGYVDGFLNSLRIAKISSNVIGIDSGLLSIQGFRSVNDTLTTYTVSVTPSEPIPFQLVATYSHYISDENDTLEITTRPVQELSREPLFAGQNAVYEVELAEFTLTSAGIADDFVVTLEKVVYNEQDLSELLDKVTKAEADSAEAKEIASGLADSIAEANTTAQQAVSTANQASQTANQAKSTAESAVSTANAAQTTAQTALTTANGLAASIAQANTTAGNALNAAQNAQTIAQGLQTSKQDVADKNLTTTSKTVVGAINENATAIEGLRQDFINLGHNIATTYATQSALSNETSARQEADTTLQTNIDAKYTKPLAGIPESDLSAELQAKIDSIGDINTVLESILGV